MLSDIEIAQAATFLPIKEVAAQIEIKEDELEFYGCLLYTSRCV